MGRSLSQVWFRKDRFVEDRKESAIDKIETIEAPQLILRHKY